MKKFFNEFKTFAMRGNVIDLAVGVVIGGAFGKITSSLVADIIMPLVGLAVGGLDVSQWKIVLKEAVVDAAGAEVSAAVSINYGNLISTIIDFIILAFAVFRMVKFLNSMHQKKEEAPAAPPAPPEPSAEEKLLTEIRDLLKEQK